MVVQISLFKHTNPPETAPETNDERFEIPIFAIKVHGHTLFHTPRGVWLPPASGLPDNNVPKAWSCGVTPAVGRGCFLLGLPAESEISESALARTATVVDSRHQSWARARVCVYMSLMFYSFAINSWTLVSPSSTPKTAQDSTERCVVCGGSSIV